MKLPKTTEAIEKLLAEVNTLADAIEAYERRHAETWAKVNHLGTRLDRLEAVVREMEGT